MLENHLENTFISLYVLAIHLESLHACRSIQSERYVFPNLAALFSLAFEWTTMTKTPLEYS